MTARVVGIGNPERGDDGLGPAVVDELRRRGVLDASAAARGRPTDLVELCDGHDLVVVVDAVRTGGPPGTITVEDIGTGSLPKSMPVGGTHGFGVVEAMELRRVLGRLTGRIVLVAVEADRFELGVAMSPAVSAAVTAAADAVVALVADGA